jgi:hypothetical protein
MAEIIGVIGSTVRIVQLAIKVTEVLSPKSTNFRVATREVHEALREIDFERSLTHPSLQIAVDDYKSFLDDLYTMLLEYEQYRTRWGWGLYMIGYPVRRQKVASKLQQLIASRHRLLSAM